MNLPPRKKEQLTRFLGALPTGTAVKLFAALEADRIAAASGKGKPSALPHNELLDDLRARLLADGAVLPVRRGDAKRVFFTPFEDFFIGERRGRKRPGQIPRSSLGPIWRRMMRDAALSEAAFAAASLDDAIRANKPTGDLERALFLAAEAGLGRLCDAAVVEAGTRDKLVDALGGDAVFADLQELRRLLAGVETLRKLHRTLPAGASQLTDEHCYALRQLFLSAHDQSPQLASFLLLAVKGRLDKPWRALGLYYHFARSADERLDDARDAASTLPEALLEDLEALARALEKDGAAASEFDPEAARLRVSWFADYADGLAGQAAKIGDNVLVNRVEACRDIAAEAFERFCELALAALRKATPTRAGAGSTRLMAARPDFSEPLSAGLREDASAAAALIAAAPGLAARLGATSKSANMMTDEARDNLHVFANDLVTEIRAADGDERKAARAMLEHVLFIAAPLLAEDEAGLINDRADAAAVAV